MKTDDNDADDIRMPQTPGTPIWPDSTRDVGTCPPVRHLAVNRPWLDSLEVVVQRLAASADEQREYLIELLGRTDTADELALEFDALYGIVPRLIDDGLLSREIAPILAQIDQIFQEMTKSGPEVWRVDQLATSSQWQDVRRLAGMACGKLGPSKKSYG